MTDKKRVIADTRSRVVVVEEVEDGVELRDTYYPIPGYGNYTRDVIRVTGNTLTFYNVRDTWNGTGRTDYGSIVLDDDKAALLKSTILNMQSIEDVEMLEENVRKILEEEEEKVEKIMNELSDTILELVRTGEEREILERFKEEELRELVDEFIREKLESALDDC